MLLGIFLSLFCSNNYGTMQKFEKEIRKIENKYIPDKSLAVFKLG